MSLISSIQPSHRAGEPGRPVASWILGGVMMALAWGAFAPIGHDHAHASCEVAHESCPARDQLEPDPRGESERGTEPCPVCLVREVRETSPHSPVGLAVVEMASSPVGAIPHSDLDTPSLPPYSLASPRAPPSRRI